MLIRPFALVAMLACLCLCECAAAPRIHGAPPAPPEPLPAAPSDADALRGPTVSRSPNRPEHSIVERDFNGRLRKSEEHPVLLALARLDLTPEQKAAADKVLAERGATLDTIVRDNLRLLVEYAQAKQSDDAPALAKLQPEILEKVRPFLKRGTMLSELVPVLPEDKLAELRRMLDEYNAVAAQDRAADSMTGKDKPNRLGAMLAGGFENFGAEARASYERVVGAAGKDFENLIKMLVLTPEQESKVRQKVGDLFQKTYGKPTKGQIARLFLDVYADLDTEQRHRLARYIGEENRARRPRGTLSKP
ncbi:MAG TPA: hypothetical protein PKE29_07060 [Phycisphaerales bacterium]|nr:hypothetical protein [Phycisphaerales bacterium]